MQMGTADTARRMRVEHELKVSNEALGGARRWRAPPSSNPSMPICAAKSGVRHDAEVRALTQLERLDLLRRITRAIAERQDLDSIFQVVVRSVEEHLPADFAAMCTREADGAALTVTRVGERSEPLALELAMPRADAHRDRSERIGALHRAASRSTSPTSPPSSFRFHSVWRAPACVRW